METTALCTTDSFEYMREIGATDVVDYRQTNWLNELSQKPKYIVFYCCHSFLDH